jgi:hypothetical protein
MNEMLNFTNRKKKREKNMFKRPVIHRFWVHNFIFLKNEKYYGNMTVDIVVDVNLKCVFIYVNYFIM